MKLDSVLFDGITGKNGESDFLRAILETVEDGIVACDAQGVLRYFNRATRELHGLPETPIPAEKWADYYSLFQADGETPLQTEEVPLFRALREGVVQSVEMVIAPRGKPPHHVITNGRAIYDSNGKKIGAVVSMHEVTARREAQAEREARAQAEKLAVALQHSQQRLRENAEQLNATLIVGSLGTWCLDLESNIAHLSSAFCRICGLDDSVQQLTLEEFLPVIHPDDREQVAHFTNQACQQRQRVELEYRIIPPAGEHRGEVRWLLSRGGPVMNEHGEVVSIQGACLDITERKRTEEALRQNEILFRQLADAVPQMVWVTRPDGYHEYYNQRWYEFTGVPDGSTDGEGWNAIFHPDDQARAWQRWRHSLATGEPYEIEYRLRHHSGQYRWTLGRALPIRGASGEIERWFGTCTDIEDFKKLQAEREQLLESEHSARLTAERESRLKDEFLATLSHELRTPLNAVLGWSQLIGGGHAGEEEIQEGLQIIERNARAQAQLIEDLLDMSRIISGKVRLHMQNVSLNDVLEAAFATLLPVAEAKGVWLRKTLDPLAGPVYGDPNRLQQVIWNLLSNAVKFTPRDGKIEVLLERTDSHLEVSVKDSGSGIAPEFLPHVFDRFRQADGTTTRHHGGLGLGLSIAKQLVELHNGTVRAKSPGVGLGATFVVSLPLAQFQTGDALHEAQHASEYSTKNLHCTHRLDNIRVLVVDDVDDARLLVKRILDEAGAETVLASSAKEALQMVPEEKPQVVISDIAMPDVDGYELMQRLRALSPEEGSQTPAIALTAFARAEDSENAMNAGFQIHLSKPVDAHELCEAVAKLAGAE